MNTQQLLEVSNSIQKVFAEQDKYQMRKVIEEFSEDSKFVGDYYNFIIFDHTEDIPTFFHIFGPYDTTTNKAPQQAIVFQNGEVILNVDYTEHANMRTGAMDALVFKNLGIDSLENKKLIMFGTGKTAKWSLKFLKATYPELKEVSYVNTRGEDSDFTGLATELGITAKPETTENIGDYDLIICHTKTKEAVLNSPEEIKQGAVITTYISSTEHGEVSDDFYSTEANIITDWETSITAAKDLNRAATKEPNLKESIIFLKELFNKESEVKVDAPYTIYRSTGTPMQNLAVLKYLLQASNTGSIS